VVRLPRVERVVEIRSAEPSDIDAWFDLFEEVAAEGRWIGAESPLHRSWTDRMFQRFLTNEASALLLAEADGVLVGDIHLEDRFGCVQLGMKVRDGHRGAGVGSMLMDACLEWCRQRPAHKVVLDVWPHNAAAIGLYRKYGFEIEGRLCRHARRQNGELWDLIQMGLVLDGTSPGSSHRDALS
jgi:ribosomal protein S18 acetylase RimI-like enzyme